MQKPHLLSLLNEAKVKYNAHLTSAWLISGCEQNNNKGALIAPCYFKWRIEYLWQAITNASIVVWSLKMGEKLAHYREFKAFPAPRKR